MAAPEKVEKPYKGKKEDWVEVKSKAKDTQSLSRKDVFFMSFLATLLVAGLSVGALFSSDALGPILESSGDKVVDEDVTGQVAVEAPVEIVVEEPAVAEEPEPECTADADCGVGYFCADGSCEAEPSCENKDVTLAVGEKTTFKGKPVILKLGGENAAQVSVGGMAQLISWGIATDINGVTVELVSGNEESVTLSLLC